MSILFPKLNCFGISFLSLFLCFCPAFHTGGFVNTSHNNECENDRLDFLFPIVSNRPICLVKGLRNGIKGWKPAKRFMMENLNIKEEKIKHCRKNKESIETDYYWAQFVKSDEMTKWNVITSLSNKTFSFPMELLKNNLSIVLEVPDLMRGAFLADFAGNATVFYFIFSRFLPHLVGPPSFETKTSGTTTITTINNTANQTTTQKTTLSTAITSNEPLSESYKFYKPITNGTTVHFKAKVDDGAKAFTIRMLHDAPKFHPLSSVRKVSENLLILPPFQNQQKLLERTEQNITVFKAGTSFDCLIMVTEIIVQNEGEEVEKCIHFHIMVDGKNFGNFTGSLPIWTLNWIQIHGDIKLYDWPDIKFAKPTSDLFKYELRHLLYDTDVLCIEGKFMEPNDFRLFLFHEVNEPNKKRDIAMQINHEFVENRGQLFIIRTFLHENKIEPNDPYGELGYKIEKGQNMTVRIRVAGKGYGITFQEWRDEVPFEDTRIPPPWAANWLTVKGVENVALSDNETRCKGKVGQEELPGNILQLYFPQSNNDNITQNLLSVNDSVIVSGEVVNGRLVEVSLFRGALEFDETFGQTVLRIQFNASIGKLTFNSYMAKKWAFPEEDKNWANSRALEPPLVVGGKFELKIDVITEETFAIYYGDYALYETGTMPCWAVDYIVVNGLKAPAPGEANLVRVKKGQERNG